MPRAGAYHVRFARELLSGAELLFDTPAESFDAVEVVFGAFPAALVVLHVMARSTRCVLTVAMATVGLLCVITGMNRKCGDN